MSTNRPVPARAAELRAKIAVGVRDGRDVSELRAELLAEKVKKTVASWPEISDEQRARLASLLSAAAETAVSTTDAA